MQFLDFEAPIAELYKQIESTKELAQKNEMDMDSVISDLENKIVEKRKEIFANITPWQRVQLSRHPDRPYSLYYIETICDEFVELFGDRLFKDDKAIVGGIGKIDGHSFMIIGHQKGVNTKMRKIRNFGMANPEGYRKAMRLMRMAEKFNIPVVTFIDTPGAYPGLEAEERGQAEAIAKNLFDMTNLKVPVLCYIIGEGASGGALGIGVGDLVIMLENTWYTVISPESCSSILWRSWEFKEEAANQLKLTSKDMLAFGLIDEVIEEPLGGAHVFPNDTANALKSSILQHFNNLKTVDPEVRIQNRINKYSKMGFFDEVNS